MKKINKKIILFLIVFSIGFLNLLSGKVEASETTSVTNSIELLSTLESPTINTNVRLDDDIELTTLDKKCNYNIASDSVLDLNGHTITINKTVGFEAGINVFFQNDDCTLTIKDSVGEGKIDGKGSTNSLIQISNYKENDTYYNGCNVIIEGGTFEGPSSSKYLITTSNSDKVNLTINGGTFVTNFNSATIFTYNAINLIINQMVATTNIERAGFNITNDETEISKVVNTESEIWVNGIRKYTDSLKDEIGSIYGYYDSINERTGIIEIKKKEVYDEPFYVGNIDELNEAIQAPEVKTIVLSDDITSTSDLEININGNEKVLDLDGWYLYLDGESKIKVNYYTNHDFVINNDERMEGTIQSTNTDVLSRLIFSPINYTNSKVNMIVNGLAVETNADRIFEDTKGFNLTINNGFFSSSNSLFKFNTSYNSKITINRLTLRNITNDYDEILKLASLKYSSDPLSSILGANSKLVYIDSDDELIDQPNSTLCGEAYRGDGTLIVMPSKGLEIEKVVIDEQEYGYDEPNQTDIVIKNITDETITIDSIGLKRDGNEQNFHDDKLKLKEPMEILPGRANSQGSLSIRPKINLPPGIYNTTIIINTIDGDEYRGQVEFVVNKIHQELSIDISDWEYGETAIEPVGSGKQGNAEEHFEYALKEKGKTIEQLSFSKTVPTHAGKYIVKYVVEDTDEIYAGGYETKEFEIKRKEIPLPQILVSGYEENYTYRGKAYKPEVTVKIADSDITLIKGEDYTVEYGDNINAGKGTITIKSASTSNYIFAEKPIEFNIIPKDIQESSVQVPTELGYENGKTLTPTVKVNVDGKELVKDIDYIVNFEGQNGKVGEKIKVTIQGKGNYSGTVEKYVNIIEKKNQNLSFAQREITKKYLNSKFTIKVNHTGGNGKITYYSSNPKVVTVNKTTGEVTIVGVGEADIKATASETEIYKETTASYKIKVNKADYDISKMKFENLSVTFDGKAHSIVATGLPKGVTVTYKDNNKIQAGTYQVTAIFKGDYAHYNSIPNKQATLTITNKSIANATVSGIKDKTYTGKKIKQYLNIKDGNITLKEGTDYTVSYSPNKKIGDVTITIIGKGNYAGTITRTFKIIPKGTSIKKLKAQKKKFYVTWKKQRTQTSGYEIQYSTNKKFKNGNKKAKIKNNKTTSSTIKKLKAKKKYYVRIRTYKIVNGKKFYSEWSKAKNVKIKK